MGTETCSERGESKPGCRRQGRDAAERSVPACGIVSGAGGLQRGLADVDLSVDPATTTESRDHPDPAKGRYVLFGIPFFSRPPFLTR